MFDENQRSEPLSQVERKQILMHTIYQYVIHSYPEDGDRGFTTST